MKPNTIQTAIAEIDTLIETRYRHGGQYSERSALSHLRERLIHLAEASQNPTPTTRSGAEHGRRPNPERF